MIFMSDKSVSNFSIEKKHITQFCVEFVCLLFNDLSPQMRKESSGSKVKVAT